jgi:dimeric dUTPase (all-alpha-NTP-PPase superfamily)
LHFYLSWTNSFEIDFSDYEFRKLITVSQVNNGKFEQNLTNDFNELLLSLFSETELFSLEVSQNNSLLERIKIEKTKESFYRWLMIFEELAQKMGMDEKSIEEEYIKKNKENWKRQQEKY